MIFSKCSAVTQAIIIKDYILWKNSDGIQLTVIEAYNELLNNEEVTYCKDGTIE